MQRRDLLTLLGTVTLSPLLGPAEAELVREIDSGFVGQEFIPSQGRGPTASLGNGFRPRDV